jgi:hypothetical protein
MDEIIAEEKSSALARFQYRFSLWNPWRRVFFVVLILLLIACIPMLVVWMFPPPLIFINLGADPPTLTLANNWPIPIPMVLVVIGVLGTNLVFRISEDTKFHLRVISLIVCVEIVVLASAVALSAQMYWYYEFYPILNPGLVYYPLDMAELSFSQWIIMAINAFLMANGAFASLLSVTGAATMIFTLICESMI